MGVRAVRFSPVLLSLPQQNAPFLFACLHEGRAGRGARDTVPGSGINSRLEHQHDQREVQNFSLTGRCHPAFAAMLPRNLWALPAVYGLVAWWKAEGREIDRVRRAPLLSRLRVSEREDPFAAVTTFVPHW
jgi:hypothetical protein